MLFRSAEEMSGHGLSTPGRRVKAEEAKDDDEEELPSRQATAYRALVARANYLAQDRTDIRFAVKELSRHMSKPNKRDKQALIRFGKYLKGKERWVQLFHYQESTSKHSNKYINVWVDTDYAGCLETRKSTSGGVIMINQHTIKSWSVTQDIVALSSGEAEYYGMVRGGAQGLGALTLLNDMGVSMKLRLRTDASVAKSIASRRGIGRVRHIEVNQLWLQERVNIVHRKGARIEINNEGEIHIIAASGQDVNIQGKDINLNDYGDGTLNINSFNGKINV